MDYIDNLIIRYPALEACRQSLLHSYEILESCYSGGHKLLVAGNGGSCADSEHIVGELMKGFKLPRHCSDLFKAKLIEIDPQSGEFLSEKLQKALPAIALDNHPALNTAIINDVGNGGSMIYAQQVFGYGALGDVFLGISTSGNSKNVYFASVTAKAMGLKVIGLTGAGGGKIAEISDCAIKVPETETYKVQELHLPIYHALCLMLENHFFA